MNGALIVDQRPGADLPEIIDGHMAMLPKDWGLQIYCNPRSVPALTKRFRNSKVRPVDLRSFYDYQRLLTSKSFWEGVAFDKVLVFQRDTRLLRTGIEEFMDYDWVGAPWKFQDHGGNGGLSLRSRKFMLDVIAKVARPTRMNEDMYFCNFAYRVGGRLAPREICTKFSCETIFELGTLGCHAIERYFTPEDVTRILSQYSLQSKHDPRVERPSLSPNG